MLTVEVGGESLTLLPEKAAFLDHHRTLLIADAHIGKAVSFRTLGVPVPRGTTSDTLSRVTQLVERTCAERLVFLGDFLHSSRSHAASTMAVVTQWRHALSHLDIVLVRGNHDDRAGDPPASLRITVVDEPLRLGGLALCHHPTRRDGRYVLGGHLHPCVNVFGRAHDRLRLACFHLGPHVGVLPAFGSFTGMHPIERREGDRVFAIAGDEVMPVQTAPSHAGGRGR